MDITILKRYQGNQLVDVQAFRLVGDALQASSHWTGSGDKRYGLVDTVRLR